MDRNTRHFYSAENTLYLGRVSPPPYRRRRYLAAVRLNTARVAHCTYAADDHMSSGSYDGDASSLISAPS